VWLCVKSDVFIGYVIIAGVSDVRILIRRKYEVKYCRLVRKKGKSRKRIKRMIKMKRKKKKKKREEKILDNIISISFLNIR